MAKVNSGRVVVLGMLVVGACCGISALVHNYRMGHQVVQFWGTQAALLLDHAPVVEILRLDGAGSGPATDVSRGKGLSNLRRALTLSEAYDWEAKPTESAGYRYRFIFRTPSDALGLDFDPDQGWLREDQGTKQICLRPQVCSALLSFINENLPAESK
jgi:hypothetical protein